MDDVRATVPTPAIPGWRLIISDRGRFWAMRRSLFPVEAMRAGADSTVDAGTFDEVRAAVERQEEIARQVTGQVTS